MFHFNCFRLFHRYCLTLDWYQFPEFLTIQYSRLNADLHPVGQAVKLKVKVSMNYCVHLVENHYSLNDDFTIGLS